ncbi:MAG: hypothetical protein CM15mP62_21320 [Rhodospirillaceae bacterium]|nr:MAG: hypothetical protein CM15mP62_21320 [Rhodospirillaceae bacterium]
MDQLEEVVKAFMPQLEKRVAEKFNAKPLAVWPYGPQVFYCNAEIKSLNDFKGLKLGLTRHLCQL